MRVAPRAKHDHAFKARQPPEPAAAVMDDGHDVAPHADALDGADRKLPQQLQLRLAGTQPIEELLNLVADIYARNFTAAELREVSTFYKGPVGQKFLEKMPAITQESMMAGQRWGQAIATELRGKMIEELRKRGHNI